MALNFNALFSPQGTMLPAAHRRHTLTGDFDEEVDDERLREVKYSLHTFIFSLV